MSDWINQFERGAVLAIASSSDDSIVHAGQRLEGKLQRMLAAAPLPAKNLDRRRIAHNSALHVRSEFDELSGIYFVHGVRVVRLAKAPHNIEPLPPLSDVVSVLRAAGDRPAEHSADPDLRAAAEHLRCQTQSYLSAQKHSMAPNAILHHGLRARVEIEVLNFCSTATGVVSLVTHVVIEVGRIGAYDQDE